MNKGSFHIDKWYLDFVGDEGETMIFYAAKLTWMGITVPYTNWLYLDGQKKPQRRSRYRNISMPEQKMGSITWGDPKWEIRGHWKSLAAPVDAKLFESEAGFLDWRCHQPFSEVTIRMNDREINGMGYAEQLILTAPPWNIPMDELRWGRFEARSEYGVWVEIREKQNKQWLWINGERIDKANIQDDFIEVPEQAIRLDLDRSVVLESEKTIYTVVEKLIKYLPGFNKIMPVHFLLAHNCKWKSRASIKWNDKPAQSGFAIHELVDFKAAST